MYSKKKSVFNLDLLIRIFVGMSFIVLALALIRFFDSFMPIRNITTGQIDFYAGTFYVKAVLFSLVGIMLLLKKKILMPTVMILIALVIYLTAISFFMF